MSAAETELTSFQGRQSYGSVSTETDPLVAREPAENGSNRRIKFAAGALALAFAFAFSTLLIAGVPQQLPALTSSHARQAKLIQTSKGQKNQLQEMRIDADHFPDCVWKPLEFRKEPVGFCKCKCDCGCDHDHSHKHGDGHDCEHKHSHKHKHHDHCPCKLFHEIEKHTHYSMMRIDEEEQHQEIIGFGGSLTESSAHVLSKLPRDVQEKVLQLYWGKDGIGYSVARIHINSCDFSLNSWNFDDVKDDYELEHFDDEVTHDQVLLIPFMKSVMDTSEYGDKFKFIASPWSPPAWMKEPVDGEQSMTGSALPDGLRASPDVHRAWAKYFSKWITAYENQGVPIWAITPQNEPLFAAPWEACAYTATSEAAFIRDYLGPELREHHPEVKIFAYDHNKDALPEWAVAMYADEQVSQYVDGLAFHWYVGGMNRDLDGTNGYDNLMFIHRAYPNKMLLGTEACSCPGVLLDDWFRTERFGHDVIADLNANAQGWIDWNVLLDFQGGPNHLNNFCDAPLIATEDFSDVHVQPKFYFMGQVSRYVPPGSRRIRGDLVGNFVYTGTSEAEDDGLVTGMELSLFHCERSSRQHWLHDAGVKKLKLASDLANNGKGICVSHKVDSLRNVAIVTECDNSDELAKINYKLDTSQLVDKQSGMCLTARDDLSWSGGSLVWAVCDTTGQAKNQRWKFDHKTGEVRPVGSDLCLTAGWPFLQGVAFLTPSGDKVAIVMNEANAMTPLVIHDKKQGYMYSVVPPKSIQTYVY